ncbi:MAG: S8 family serine peptidase [candidate division Zixibacteria bacterium]|nr:S8 family serine peptidase [candidate division Zixibacteria bacterium]
MSKRAAIVICMVLAMMVTAGRIHAGSISDQLREEIGARGADDFIRVVIIPVSDHNSAAMKTSVMQMYSTRAEQHRAVVTELKDVASRSQAPVLGLVKNLESGGQARRVKAFWIDNIIEAELPAAEIERLAADPSIEKIELYPTIVSIPIEASEAFTAETIGVQPNLMVIKADSAWKAGYDGRGRIVCNFDVGVDGNHPALFANYRGNKGYPASQCWFSPIDNSTYPHYFTTVPNHNQDLIAHGTHTMGIMVGHSSGGDTVGVAPGADWIAAVAIDVTGSSVFEAFQWAADPDGDPNTIADLPDVINHSWGIPNIGCDQLFWRLIDNVEALGIVNIFAAGNEGPSVSSLRNPANRADDSVTNFAVGAIEYMDSLAIYRYSSRGPSNCDGVSIKPNVVAPGHPIRSSKVNGTWGYMSGTSMAAPHVAGAVAILRQKNPDATVDQIKTALLASSHDLGSPGKDNTFGWGMIDIMAALRKLDQLTQPSLRVAAMPHPDIYPGDTVHILVTLTNVGATATAVIAQFSHADHGISLLTDVIGFGTIAKDSSATGNTTLDLVFNSSLEIGQSYGLDMQITASGGYDKTERIEFFMGDKGERQWFDHDAGRVKFTISNYGAYGFYGYKSGTGMDGSYIPLGYLGFQLDRDTNDMYEGALLIGTGPTRVSDCARNIVMDPDDDFAVFPDAPLIASEPGRVADQETVCRFDDSYAEHPIGLTITQKTFGWATDPDSRFIIMEYILTNTSGGTVNGIRVGLFFDWDINIYYQNHGGFRQADNLGYLCWFNNNTADTSDFRGVKVLNPEGLTGYRIFPHDSIENSNFTEYRKYAGLSGGFVYGTFGGMDDLSHMTSTGPFNLTPGETDTAVFAIIGGRTWDEFMEASVQAEQKYDIVTDVTDDGKPPLPLTFSLDQNHPNPFNPATTISFSLPKAAHTRLDVYDILGRTVRTLHDGPLAAGAYALVWDGKDADGHAVASGIYFYRLRSDDHSQSRKMILLK